MPHSPSGNLVRPNSGRGSSASPTVRTSTASSNVASRIYTGAESMASWFSESGPRKAQQKVAAQLTKHPYFPTTIKLPAYVKNSTSVVILLSEFAVAVAAVLTAAWFAIEKWRPRLRLQERLIVLWFVLTGCLHIVFEGYFVYNHDRMPGQTDVLGQLWKEYALSDSRYLTNDSFVLSIETITALIWGPLSFLTALFVTNTHPLRHPLQIIMSLAHIYGCLLYFATATTDWILQGVHHSRPEFRYFWIYYFGFNVVFIIIPGVLLVQSVLEAQDAFATYDMMRRTIPANSTSGKAEEPIGASERKKSK